MGFQNRAFVDAAEAKQGVNRPAVQRCKSPGFPGLYEERPPTFSPDGSAACGMQTQLETVWNASCLN
jgi:hypothetical protein